MTDADDEFEVTLEEMLKARDRRAAKQRQLLLTHSLPLISMTVNIPGPRKSTLMSRRIFREGYDALLERLAGTDMKLVFKQIDDLITGPEGYIIVNADERILKQFAVQTETIHPLGRLLDIDVLGRAGQPISRSDLGYPRRKCLLCRQDAHICGRSKAHSVNELLYAIRSIADAYFQAACGTRADIRCGKTIKEVGETEGEYVYR
ncbi:MAG: citrate lyase holo-[acyl-carrier protein] synthase [Paenibacillus macerans]|uniref:citrate lyase holo-[acyl-carrier protein] synthase n=1 Tax=Paenibacillus macerans TaxID=44252 RepID=A0A091A7Z2_PAEMA|nr:citrate lyase holo-[acyl-carrier protein] synthase [Paenibacillus macerans]KFN12346.1 holo-ACP synthase CitX [Paenibacillus macerans]MBS5911749.1 citrate lyase holo-[acyl-carrier protein] synthase [Paenibacillus macerans]MCY7558378.1 citrate lyase holo-[acyl-carrier protein] synthase [Paenibacillus macerans]MDU7473026.1 citrate lyase holo-[acyl-carrier protein] synthase [Paenibacillus macerans]MEC0150363.1 citrate lyase holo-[acyl-carrier protein] synthase [Paenibacillus macerans]